MDNVLFCALDYATLQMFDLGGSYRKPARLPYFES